MALAIVTDKAAIKDALIELNSTFEDLGKLKDKRGIKGINKGRKKLDVYWSEDQNLWFRCLKEKDRNNPEKYDLYFGTQNAASVKLLSPSLHIALPILGSRSSFLGAIAKDNAGTSFLVLRRDVAESRKLPFTLLKRQIALDFDREIEVGVFDSVTSPQIVGKLAAFVCESEHGNTGR